MAINNNIYAGTETEWGWDEAAAFGEAITAAAAYATFEGPVPEGIDYGITKDLTVKNDGGRMPSSLSKYHTGTGGLRVIPFSDVIVRRTDLAMFLYAVMQVMDESEAAQFTKTLTWTNTTTQPMVGDSAGLYVNIGIKDPIASNHRFFSSCILRSLTLTANLQDDPRLRASGEFISGALIDQTANFTGTWTFPTQNYYNMRALSTKQLAGADICLYGFSVTFTNKAVVISYDSSGYAEGFAMAVDNMGWELTGNVLMKYDAVTDGLVTNAAAGTGNKIQIATGTPGSAGHFDITIHEAQSEGDPSDVYGDVRGHAINFPFRAIYQNSPAASGVVCTVSDTIDRSWPT